MTNPEERWRLDLRQVADLYGWNGYHTHDSRRSDAGFPDEVYCHRHHGRLLFVELKSPAGRLSGEQRTWLLDLAACGQEVALWRPSDLQEAIRVLGPRQERAFLRLPPEKVPRQS